MFDLFRSREKSVRYLLGALLGLVALSMVITLVPGYGGGWGSSNEDPTVLAEVGGEKITATEVRQFLARELRGNQIPKGMEQFYLPMIVQQLVGRKSIAFQAERMGLKVTDEQLARIVQSLLPQLWEGGKFAGKEMYAQMLAQQNMSIPMFESLLRADSLRSRLEALAVEGIVVTPGEIEAEYRRKNDKIKIAYFGISQDLFKNKITATPAEVQEYFTQNQKNYVVPEKRSYLIFPIEDAKVAATIQISDADLQRVYAQQQERFRTPERVRARHILLKTTDKSPAEIAVIEKKAQDLLKQARGGADFAALATKNSEDTGSAVKGGDLDFLTHGQTVPEFDKAAFTVKPGQISDLVKTMYGFHIIKVESKEEARLKPFAEVRGELAVETSRGQVFDKMQRIADQIRAALVKSTAEAEKIALANGITPVRAEKAAPGDPIQEVGISPQFNDGVAGLPKNGVSPIIQIGQNKLIVAQVAEIFPSRPAEFADVEKQVREALLTKKGQDMAQQKIAEATSKLKGINGDLAGLAKQMGAEVKTSDLVTREGAITGLGAATSAEEGFSKNTGDVFGPVVTPNGTYYCKVVEKQAADLVQLATQRAEMLFQIKSRRSRERAELFADGVVQSLIKQKKVKIYEDNVKKLVASYRS
ncbi:MAG: peptidylprolyl isomerase [Bryobacterales bacterium]|nr:peptidylprolyl isomerase [Bryobacterales bacterium]